MDNRKQHMAKGILLSFCSFLLIVTTAMSQNIQFTGSARSVVGVGETFNLVYSVNAQATGFHGPSSVQGFDILTGPYTSTSSSISAVNGRTTMSISNTFTYILRASREGNFDIPAATVTVDNKQYKSNIVTIKVVKDQANTQGAAPGGSGSATGKSQGSAGEVNAGSNDVFIKTVVDNSNPLQGEGITFTYKIFFKVPISQPSITKPSSYDGFWSHPIKDNGKLGQYNQTIDGETYHVADLLKVALFPLKSGRLVIDPYELECVAQYKRQTKTRTGDPFFDDFFNNSFFNESYANVEKNLKSNSLVINVRPLPTAEKPVDFSGAVGTFTFKSDLDKTQTKTNDPINLKCTISGNGNIQLIDKLNTSFPPDFETYDPKITTNVNATGTGVSGSQTFEYLIIPRKAGKFTIKPIPFSYFDLEKKRYVTLTSPEYTINVEKGSSSDNNLISYSGAGKEDIKYIGSDIRHIKDQVFLLQRTGTFFFGSPLFFLVLILPVVIFFAFIFTWRKLEERRSDTLLMKNRKATRVAIKRLKKASVFLKEQKQEPFYIEISQALWGYLSDKFSIPLAELSMESVNEALMKKNVKEEIIKQFIQTLDNTEFARFAPGEKALIMEKTYNEALEIITRIERELR